MLPENVKAIVKKDSYPVPPIFNIIKSEGDIAEEMMYNTFNMGLGMILAVRPENAKKTIEAIDAAGEKAFTVGEVVEGEKGVELV